MQSDKQFFDDMAKIAGSAMGTAAEMKREVEQRLHNQVQQMLSRMDMVSREEFDAIKAVAVAAREAQENLEKRVAALEKQLQTGTVKKSTSRVKTAKKTAKKKGS